MTDKQKLYSDKLSEQYNAIASKPADCGNRKIAVGKDLYDTYIKLYFRSLHLAQKLEQIVNDGEHQLCMQEGRDAGWNLPKGDYMREDVLRLKSFLKGLDPFNSVSCRGGSHVKISAHMAVDMHHLLQINILMVGKLFDMFRETDYLNYHRELKAKGFKYAGPTSLSEIVNIYMQSAHTQNKTQHYLQQRKIPQDWHKRVIA